MKILERNDFDILRPGDWVVDIHITASAAIIHDETVVSFVIKKINPKWYSVTVFVLDPSRGSRCLGRGTRSPGAGLYRRASEKEILACLAHV